MMETASTAHGPPMRKERKVPRRMPSWMLRMAKSRAAPGWLEAVRRARVEEADSRRESESARHSVNSSLAAAVAPSATVPGSLPTKMVSISERIGSMRVLTRAGSARERISRFSATIRNASAFACRSDLARASCSAASCSAASCSTCSEAQHCGARRRSAVRTGVRGACARQRAGAT